MKDQVAEDKSYEVVEAEVRDMLDTYFEKHQVPFAWEAKILFDVASNAIHDQFSTHEEDIIALNEEVAEMKKKINDITRISE